MKMIEKIDRMTEIFSPKIRMNDPGWKTQDAASVLYESTTLPEAIQIGRNTWRRQDGSGHPAFSTPR
jgi:hypothetical protein